MSDVTAPIRGKSYQPAEQKALTAEGADRVLYYTEAPHDTYLVFAPPVRALYIDRLYRAMEESKTWDEFRKRLPPGEYEKLYEEQFSSDPDVLAEDEDAREPSDDEPFNSECVPGYSDGDYPPWLAAEQELYLPTVVLREFATREDTFLNGSFWRLDASRLAMVVQALERLGYQVERREDLKFW